MKPQTFSVNNEREFHSLIKNKNFDISKAIVNSILNNLKSKRKNIHILTVKCLDEDTIFDVTLEKSHFAETLRDNIKFYEKLELYEECDKINKAINELIK